jgi:hypothetical protein
VPFVVDPEPDQPVRTLNVGQDAAGHWLVQDSAGLLEGRFISLDAAIGFARSEGRGIPGVQIAVVATPLISQISFAPLASWETALRRAA